jgi:anti-sigma-K factor RskA
MADAMSHDEVADLLALEAVGALEPSDRDDMERHLATCAACRHAADGYAELASLLPAALAVVPPPARLRRNLMAQVYAEATASPMVPWWRRLIDAIPASRTITVVGAAAVIAAIALAIWGATGRTNLLQPAVTVAYAVSGTTATGTLDVPAGGAPAVLLVNGLQPLPSTKTYEVWLIPSQGSPKGVAFLSPSPQVGGWVAAIPGSLAGYKSLAATVEPAGGSPTPSNSEVLSGQLSAS